MSKPICPYCGSENTTPDVLAEDWGVQATGSICQDCEGFFTEDKDNDNAAVEA